MIISQNSVKCKIVLISVNCDVQILDGEVDSWIEGNSTDSYSSIYHSWSNIKTIYMIGIRIYNPVLFLKRKTDLWQT